MNSYRLKRSSAFTANALFLTLLLFFSSCANKTVYKLNFNPEQSLRVAVLPFAQFDADSGEFAQSTPNLLVDRVSIISKEPLEIPAKFVRTLVQNELRKTSLELITPSLVELEIPHHGFAKKDGSFDIKKLYNANPAEICSHLIQCDAVMYGKIYKWDRSYYGLESVNTVEIELNLVSATTNQTIFTSRLRDTESRGILGGPTGFSDLLLEPIRGLDSEIIEDLARSMIGKLLEPIASYGATDNQPESSAPMMFAATHDARYTADQSMLLPKETLTVLLYGTENMTASFRIGDITGDIPMTEHQPGHYTGVFFPLARERFFNQKVFVQLSSPRGKASEQEIFKPSLSIVLQ
jgi:hypothetical protein